MGSSRAAAAHGNHHAAAAVGIHHAAAAAAESSRASYFDWNASCGAYGHARPAVSAPVGPDAPAMQAAMQAAGQGQAQAAAVQAALGMVMEAQAMQAAIEAQALQAVRSLPEAAGGGPAGAGVTPGTAAAVRRILRSRAHWSHVGLQA